jgi:capsular polysaccharide biosynthesis protein
MNTEALPQVEEDEMSLKDMILLAKEYAMELWQHKLWIVLGIVLGTGYFYYEFTKQKVKYTAGLSILINNSGSSSLLSSLTGGLGLGGSKDFNALAKVKVIMSSREIMGKTLLSNTTLGAKNNILGNYFVDSCGYRGDWSGSKEPLLNGFTAFKHHAIDSCNAEEWRAIEYIRSSLLNGAMKLEVGESDILSVSMTGRRQALICEFLNTLYRTTEEYYLVSQMGAEVKTFDAVKSKKDSIDRAISGLQHNMANFADSHKSSLFEIDKVPLVKMESDLMALNAMKAEATTRYELARFSTQSKQPYITSIDTPRMPLVPVFPSKKSAVINGFLIGAVVSAALIILRKILKKVMA